ncbi:restriction endonuclease subunit S [Marinobacter sp. Arc7-DN-1]|uniref:restriction endonuclease subunit S n=1 Tax=Marinobacter sp. Arc7-DN-1 TaxID=2304594 RepID=UPI000E438C7F|nr:restriction endonuclease subunit S [Marinobacter sp. Arc7-DN-1]AXS81892.1 restriction endonuclease [Marinobacter sp. Arc7-DN-1]
MQYITAPIIDHVDKVESWNPKSIGSDAFQYIDLSSVDKEMKQVIPDSVPRLQGQDAPSRARYIVRKGDVLVSTVRPNLNGVAVINEEMDGATASTGYCVLRPNNTSLDSQYLFHWVQTPAFVEKMVKQATGANYPAVSDKIIKKSRIPLPSFDEQKRIAATLDKAYSLRRNRLQAMQLADQLLCAAFLDMYGDPVTNPKGWDVQRMGDVIDFKGGSQPPKSTFVNEPRDGYVRLIQIRDFKSDRYPTYIPAELAKRQFDVDDVMIARYGPPVFQILRGLSGSYNVALMKAIPKGGITKDFIFHLLRLPAYQNRVIAASERTAGQTGVNLKLLNNFDVPLPPVEAQKKICLTLSRLEKLTSEMQSFTEDALDLFNGLSQKAFSGLL